VRLILRSSKEGAWKQEVNKQASKHKWQREHVRTYATKHVCRLKICA